MQKYCVIKYEILNFFRGNNIDVAHKCIHKLLSAIFAHRKLNYLSIAIQNQLNYH